MDEEIERWRTLVYHKKTFDNFEVSNTGKLRNTVTGTEYKTHLNKQGYYQVCVSLGSRKNKHVFKIHRAVAETFIENANDKPQINHIDGNKLNNNLYNLEWSTSSENIRHAYDIGLAKGKRGEDANGAKLTNEQAKYIREHYIPRDKEFGCRALANKFGVDHNRISNIIHNKSYASI